MITITLESAEKDLNHLVEKARAGEEVVITKGDEPVARLVAVVRRRTPRVPGRLRGMLDLPDSFFFDPLPDDELNLWSGEVDDVR